MVPVPVAVNVTLPVPVKPALRTMESLVPVPSKVRSSPLTAPATVMVPALLVLVSVKSLTVEAFNVIAAALSVTERLPEVLALKVPAAVLTLYVVAFPDNASEPVLAVLLMNAVPAVLAVMLPVVEPVVMLFPAVPILPAAAFKVKVGVVIVPVD